MLVAIGLVLLAVVICTALYLKQKKRELADLANLENLANGEYLNRSKAERFLFAKQKTYPTEAEYSSEYSVQETPGIYTRSISSKKLNAINKINENFVEKRLAESKNLFDTLDLTNTQQLAVVRDEDANLINAGAGSGKTRTILGKVQYLIEQGLAKPDEILVVAYNKKIKQEIEQKIKNISMDVTVSTFHAFGREIMQTVESDRVAISGFAGDSRKLDIFLSEKMREVLKIPSILHLLINFFSTYRFEGNPEEGIKNKDEYFRKISYVGRRSLDGKTLQSHQEVQIANWLILSGIKWEYERDYPYNNSKKQYKPDFYLPDYDVWIEHFGIDEHGNTAPWVEKEKYTSEMKWKLDIHRKNKTLLVKTYSYEYKKKGGVRQALEEKLAEHGIEKMPISEEYIDCLVKENFKPTSNFIKLVKQFLSLCRENKFNAQELEKRAISGRNLAFLAIFNLFRESYEQKLKTDNEIDFTDMITCGIEYVKTGKYQSKFKYILVDEYQDITKVRLDFLLALRKQVKDARLFCVGDDWQSIYQFQGANVDLITHFENHVGAMQRTDLDKTFRYSQKNSDFSRIFITQNPAQLKKTINSNIASLEEARPIRIIYYERQKQREELNVIVDLIASKYQDENKCFVLGRYNYSKPDSWEEIKNYAKSKDVDMEFSTIHQSKGRESDWVVVLENKSHPDGCGFPSEIQNDPVLKMVLTHGEEFSHAEERRLFYVAITRARRGVFLLTPIGETSEFIQEIDPSKNIEYAPFVIINEYGSSKMYFCPECKGQTIRKTPKKDGSFFYGCSHHPSCKGSLLTCIDADCDAAIYLQGLHANGIYKCECGHKYIICPQCRRGVLKQIDGERGKFWGCSQFSLTECRYKKNILWKN